MYLFDLPAALLLVKRRHLLLIDDENDIREVAGLSLEMTQGWAITTANGGAAGIAAAGTCAPDAILLDGMLPDLDGPGTLRLLQSQDSSLSIRSRSETRSTHCSRGARSQAG